MALPFFFSGLKQFEPPRRKDRQGLVKFFPRSGKTIREKANSFPSHRNDSK